MRSNAEFKDYLNTEVDGNPVPADEVEVTAGSTVVTLSAIFLQGLEVGTRTVRINSATGSAETIFLRLATATQASVRPQTSDESEPMVWGCCWR